MILTRLFLLLLLLLISVIGYNKVYSSGYETFCDCDCEKLKEELKKNCGDIRHSIDICNIQLQQARKRCKTEKDKLSRDFFLQELDLLSKIEQIKKDQDELNRQITYCEDFNMVMEEENEKLKEDNWIMETMRNQLNSKMKSIKECNGKPKDED